MGLGDAAATADISASNPHCLIENINSHDGLGCVDGSVLPKNIRGSEVNCGARGYVGCDDCDLIK